MNAPSFKYFVILGAMRTGSNLLEGTLAQFPEISVFGELFNPAFIGGPNRKDFPGWDIARRDSAPFELLEEMQRIGTPGTLPGFRLFQDHDPRVLSHVLGDPSCAKIVLNRDPLDSYVSLKIARKTNQWVLGGIAHRKSASIQFNEHEYETFEIERAQFYRDIRRALQTLGQTAFELDYQSLKTESIINGLATFLCDAASLQKFAEPTKRQNPEAMVEKVENFDEMQQFLHERLGQQAQGVRAPEANRIDDRLISFVSERLNLAYVPIPGVPDAHYIKFLRDAGPLERVSNINTLEKWFEARKGACAVTMMADPLLRAFHVYKTHILPGPAEFSNIRRRLIDNFGLPDASDPSATGLEAFLQFLKANLSGQTALRVAREWAPQVEHIAAINQKVPISMILRAEDPDWAMASDDTIAKLAGDLRTLSNNKIRELCAAAYANDLRWL